MVFKRAVDRQEFSINNNATVLLVDSRSFETGEFIRSALTLASVKTRDRQVISGPHALFFIRELRDYLEGFGF